jgi:hypothetical protein
VRRLWGCYSVADHLEPRAFVADLLLYDRLVIPTPAADDLDRWEARWDPDRQRRLLDILGPFAERMEWNIRLRGQLDETYPQVQTAQDVDDPPPASEFEGKSDDYMGTRWVIGRQLSEQVRGAGDVRGVAVYARPDRFDCDWSFGGAFPFVRRGTRVDPGQLREGGEPISDEQHERAKLLVTRLVVPDDGDSDEEVLKRTVELVSRDDIAQRRAEMQQLIATIGPDLKPETVAGELDDLVDGLNTALRRRTARQRWRTAVQVIATAQGAAALWAPPVGVAAGPTAAIGEALIERRYGAPAGIGPGAVELLADAQRALS